MKARSRAAFSIAASKLRLPAVFILCAFFFLAGLFASTLLFQEVPDVPRPRVLQSVGGAIDFELFPSGETGDSYLTRISFQVLSWEPRALYFPDFATAEQCQHIIKLAKENLTPSTLALREGETENSTQGVRTSSGTFVSSSEDKSGILGLVEEKIAKATMIPRAHGEAFNVLRYEIGQKYDSHYDAFHPAEYGPQRSQREKTISCV